jgi:hypothetical protein
MSTSPSPSLLPLLIALAWVLVPAFVLLLAVRWKREQIPPSCRRCGYDVSKRPSGVERCSECGADLTIPRGIITARRRGHPWIVIPVAVALALATLWFVLNVATFPWTQWMLAKGPVWWLQRQAKHDLGPAGDAYRAAWLARAPSPALDDHLLDVQRDASVPWNRRWGDVLMGGMKAGRLSEAQKQRFVRQLFTPVTFTARSPVRVGDPLIIGASWPGRGPSDGQLKTTFAAAATQPAATIDPDRCWIVGTITAGRSLDLRARDWGGNHLPPGRHTIHVAVANEFVQNDHPYPALSPRVEVHADLTIDVLPKGTALGEPIVDPSKADEVARAVNVTVSHWHDDRCFAEVRLFKAGVDRAFAIYAVIDGQEKRIGYVSATAGQDDTSNALYVPVPVARARRMDKLTIVLVGDGEALKESASRTKYWVGRIVFPDVALGAFAQHYDSQASNQPTTWPYRIESTTRPATAPVP